MTASDGVAAPAVDRRRLLGKRAQLLAGASVSYNLIEAAISVAAGAVAGSVALVGFGLDSLVEVSSGLVILWQFRHRMPETRERQALRLIALSFFALATYVTVESVRNLLGAGEAAPSPVGIGIATASLIVMPFLSWAQRRTGRELGSGSVVADSKQTLLCTYLSAVLLAGLVLNATLGWGWADPVVGLVIAGVAVREGLEAWRGSTSRPRRDGADKANLPPSAGLGHRRRAEPAVERHEVDQRATAVPHALRLPDRRPAAGSRTDLRPTARRLQPCVRGRARGLNRAVPRHQLLRIGRRAKVLGYVGMARRFDRVVVTLLRHLDQESDVALSRGMHYPTSWDPYFKAYMTLADLFRYPTQHFEHHRRQLTLGDAD